MQKQSGNYIAIGHSLFIPEDKDRSNIFMHGHFCLRIENIFDDDDDEVTKSKKLEMNQETMQVSYELFYLYATFPSLLYE